MESSKKEPLLGRKEQSKSTLLESLSPSNTISFKFAKVIDQTKWFIILFWFVALAVGALFAPKFIDNTALAYSAPTGTPSKIASDIRSLYFPNISDSSSTIVLVTKLEGKSPISSLKECDVCKSLELRLNSSLLNTMIDDFVLNEIQSYYLLLEQGLESVSGQVMTTNGTVSIMSMTVAKAGSGSVHIKADRMVEHVKHTLEKLAAETGADKLNLVFRFTGITVFAKEIVDGVEKDMLTMDAISFPLAFIVLAIVLRSVRLLITPIFCMLFSVGISFGIMYPISKAMDVASFAPSVMMSLSIAMSIDYSLFVLSRYREEIERSLSLMFTVTNPTRPINPNDPIKTSSISILSPEGHPPHALVLAAISRTLRSAGHTVLVSGFTLALCFFGMLFFPVAILQSVGLGAGLSILFAIASSLTFTPSVLLAFPWISAGLAKAVIQRLTESMNSPRTRSKSRSSSFSPDHDLDVHASNSTQSLLESGSVSVMQKRNLPVHLDDSNEVDSRWKRLAIWTIKYRYLVVLALVGISIPFALKATKFSRSSSFEFFTPRGSPSSLAYLDLLDAFGAGSLFPFSVILIPPKGNSVISKEFFNTSASLFDHLANTLPNTRKTDITTLSYANGEAIDFDLVKTALSLPPEFCKQIEQCRIAVQAYHMFVGKNDEALATTISLSIDPLGPFGSTWIEECRNALAVWEASPESSGIRAYLTGFATVDYDAVKQVYDLFPTMIAVTLTVSFVLVGIAFKSIIVPLRAVATITMTVAWVYGFGSMVYEHGALNWLGIASLKETGALGWLAPVMSFSVVVGLGLDYDVFLLTRVREYRKSIRIGIEYMSKINGSNPSRVEISTEEVTPAVLGVTRMRLYSHLDPTSLKDVDSASFSAGSEEVKLAFPENIEWSALVAGIDKTGSIITAAGLVMAIAFSGLLLSSEPAVNQISFYLVFSVLLDTFVVRTILVPAIIAILGQWAWWPQ